MALLQGEDMVDVTTPDGRTLTLPRSIVPASMLPQINTAPAPSALPGMPLSVPAQETAQPVLAQPVDEPLADPDVVMSDASVVEMGEPQTRSVTQKTLAKEQAVSVAKAKKTEKAQAAYNATPQGQLAGVQNEQGAAKQDQAQALLGVADLEAAEQDAISAAKTERNKQIDELFMKRADEATKNAEAEDTKLNDVMRLRKKIEGTKIDRSADHPIILAIMAGLAGLGSAMNGGKVDTLDTIYRVIDRKVDAQTADLDQMAKVYGMSKEDLALLKDKSKSRLEFHNAMIAAETEKAVRHIEELTARSASEKTRANAKGLIADLRARAADKTMEATRWGLEFDQKDKHQKQQIGLGHANLAESRRHNRAEEQLKREDMYLDYQKALAADRAKGDELTFKARIEAEKETRQVGIKGVDNDYLLTPTGRAKMARAAQLEAEIKQIEANPDPMARSIASERVAMMRQQASVLRGDARSFDTVKARSDTQAGDMSKKYAAAQTMMDTVDEITMLYDQAGRGFITKSKLQEELQAKVGLLSVAAKDAWQLGAWDKGSAALVHGIIGQDPTTELNVGVIGAMMNQQAIKDPEGFKNRLKAVTLKLDQDVRQQIIKNTTWDGQGDLFTRKTAGTTGTPVDKASQGFSQGRSGVELQKNAEQAGTVAQVGRKVGYPFSPSHAEEAEQSQSLKYHGLSKDQEPEFEQLLRAHKSGDKAAGDQLIGMAGAAAQNRPDLAIPLLHNLREHAPTLYTAARAAVPKGGEVDTQMDMEENNRIGSSTTATPILASTVLNTMDSTGKVTDVEGMRELTRRAGAKDLMARKALLDIVNQSGKLKTLPQGSVFRGGK